MNLGMVYLEMEDFDRSLANYQIASKLIEKQVANKSLLLFLPKDGFKLPAKGKRK